jgi:hypothetical protein
LPHMYTSWCEAGHCRDGKGRLSCFGWAELCGWVVAVCLKLLSTTRDVFRSRCTEFYNTGIQRLTQRWQKCLKKTETLWKIASYLQNIYESFILISLLLQLHFLRKIKDISFVPPLVRFI